MQTVVKPLERAGRDGIILVSGDGAARRCFPILAAYVGDYPEQILVSLVKTGTRPICPAPRNEIGNWESILEPVMPKKSLKLSMPSIKELPNSRRRALMQKSSLSSVFSGKTCLIFTSTALLHLTFCINYIKASSNIS